MVLKGLLTNLKLYFYDVITPYDENKYVSFKFYICSIFFRNKNFLEVEDALDAKGFNISLEITSETDASPQHQWIKEFRGFRNL